MRPGNSAYRIIQRIGSSTSCKLRFSREHANARAKHSANDRPDCYQSDIALEKRDKNESDKRDSDGYPVNQRLRNQVQRDDCDYAHDCSADPGEERLKSAVFADFFDVVHASEHEHKRRQKYKESCERRTRNSAGNVTHKSREQHERSRRCYTESDAIEQLAVGEPVILGDGAALHENK